MGNKHDLQAVEADMTPMIDVVFQLIIFFMTTIRFKALEGKLETQLPKDSGPDLTRTEIVMLAAEIELHADALRPEGFFVTLNGSRIPNLATLRARLAEAKRVSPGLKATLRPHQGITYAQVIKVVDECLDAGMPDISFAGLAFDA
jgi:biopolymer transport protein ExbD